ncbi:flavonol 3-O-glucosyltransferase F3GT2-like [Cornus florida]|uniref:flavonol 3-O-glucosyltransferase F3GT2-like n=1 Tax=Cornus florida TaxID=4283 RepID=UPI002899C79E|nr:flavonol 3-O-glucosyltransferase F3GT2-like [Cornus florida]
MPLTGEGHIAVFAFPFGSHAASLLTLVHRLAAEAPNLRFSFLNTAMSNDKIFSTTQVNGCNIKPCNVDDGLPEGYVFSGNPLEAVDHFLKAMPDNFKRGVEAVVADTGKKITCLLTDAFLWFAGVMAEQMGVPWVALWTAGPCSIAVHVYVDLIRTTIGPTEENADRTLGFIPGLSAIQAKDLPLEGVCGDLEQPPMSRLLYNMGIKVPHATVLALNSFEEIDPTVTNDLKSKLQMVLNVGPFALTSPPPLPNSDTNGCISWLDKHEAASVAYLSFGTMATPPPNELIALGEALKAKGVPFLWSLKDTSKQHFPEGFLESIGTLGKIVPWAPQLLVLEHPSVGVFVTHCGWNSVSESISGGVPMICRSFFGDQKLNSRLVEDVWRIGVCVEGGVFAKSGTINGLDVVLSSEKGKKMRENIAVLKESAKIAVGPNGSSTENFKTLLDIVNKKP